MNKDIDSKTLIALIATRLPEFILNKLDREELKDTWICTTRLGNMKA